MGCALMMYLLNEGELGVTETLLKALENASHFELK